MADVAPCGIVFNSVTVPGPIAPPVMVLPENNHRVWLSVARTGPGGANIFSGRFDGSAPPPGVSDVSHFLFWTATDQTNNPILYQDWGPVLQKEIWSNVGVDATITFTEATALSLPDFGNFGSCGYSAYTTRFRRSNLLGTLGLLPIFGPNQNRVCFGVTAVGGFTGGIFVDGKEFIQSPTFSAQRVCPYRDYGPIITGELSVRDAGGGSDFFEIVGVP